VSKAFTKEQDNDSLDPSEELETENALPASTKNYITPAGAEKLKLELKKLLYEERPALVKTVSWAASNGDRSENGDYIYGKRRLREIDRRIRFLTKRLEAAEIVDPLTQPNDRVLFGATVTVSDEDGKKRTYRIVGIDETDVQRGNVSWISPVAKALLGSKPGDAVILHTPKGDEELEVLTVRYEAIP
jgi:transcription elongation factor GreB